MERAHGTGSSGGGRVVDGDILVSKANISLSLSLSLSLSKILFGMERAHGTGCSGDGESGRWRHFSVNSKHLSLSLSLSLSLKYCSEWNGRMERVVVGAGEW